MDSSITIDTIVTFLGQMGASAPPETAELCKAAASILFAVSDEGAKTLEDALDILYDYRLQGKQYKTLHSKHEVAGKPILKDGVWHCPSCNRRTGFHHSYCHCCGKKLGWG